MAQYNFVKFDDIHKRLENRITVTKSQSIGFPAKFYKDNKISDFKYVVLFYDSDKKAIGIFFSNDEAEKSKFKILHSKTGPGGSVISRSFFKSNDIDTRKVYGRYDWEKFQQEGVGEIYVIKLKEREVG